MGVDKYAARRLRSKRLWLLRHIDKPLLIVWDRLPAHRSRLVREFIELSEGHIVMEYLPPYAPELNPVE